MRLSDADKQQIKRELAERLKGEPEVRKVIIFGSFPARDDPNDLDVAVFQSSDQTYLPLAMKYRRLLRPLAQRIPLDVIPVRAGVAGGQFLAEIEKGEVVYERWQRRRWNRARRRWMSPFPRLTINVALDHWCSSRSFWCNGVDLCFYVILGVLALRRS
jgi:predicted nucleotidyltransferase